MEIITDDPIKEPQIKPPDPQLKKTRGNFMPLAISAVALFLLLIAGYFVLAILGSSDTKTSKSTTQKTATSGAEIRSEEDLKKVEDEVDSADLDSFEKELDENDKDAATF